MHREIQDLLPFYAAGTLSSAEALLVDQHLYTCDACRRSLDEWRTISQVVKNRGEAWSKKLPPLSPMIHDSVYRDSRLGASRGRRTPFFRSKAFQSLAAMPATALAATLTIILFSGVLVLFTSGNTNPTPQPTRGIAMLPNSPTPDAVDMATALPYATNPGTGGAGSSSNIDATISAIETARAGGNAAGTTEINPTAGKIQPSPESASLMASDGSPTPLPSPTNVVIWTDQPVYICTAVNLTSEAITIHSSPDNAAPITALLNSGEFADVWVQNGLGWLEIGRPNYGLLGWIRINSITLKGPCNDLPLPSPTANDDGVPPTAFACQVKSNGPLMLYMYAGPGWNYGILNGVPAEEWVLAVARSDNAWYRVEYYAPDGHQWIGWVSNTQTISMGNCDGLFTILSAGYSPEQPPILLTPSSLAPTSTPYATTTPMFPPDGTPNS